MPSPLPPPTNAQLASALGIDSRTVQRHLARGMPRDLQAAPYWIAMNIRRRGWRAGQPRTGQTAEARAARVKAERELLCELRTILRECRQARAKGQR